MDKRNFLTAAKKIADRAQLLLDDEASMGAERFAGKRHDGYDPEWLERCEEYLSAYPPQEVDSVVLSVTDGGETVAAHVFLKLTRHVSISFVRGVWETLRTGEARERLRNCMRGYTQYFYSRDELDGSI